MDARTLAGFGRDVQSRLRTFFDAPLGPGATPIEIVQAILDAVERQAPAVGRGRRVFPWRALDIRVLAPARSAIPAALKGLDARIRERLAEVRCEVPTALVVRASCVDEAPAEWADGQLFDIAGEAHGEMADADVETAESPAMSLARCELVITVIAGTADVAGPFREATVSIGRSVDPSDGYGHLRRNRLAFHDVIDGVNETVGRAHACLKRDGAGDYRLFDEGSRNGTAILRDGELIAVPRRDPRGVRVRSGDEIHLGRAIVRVEIVRNA
ncbi:MAG: FHA domain-containing protein [Acidobacteria bacterium]|nr:FHA domain-containing protein [Acidobacteriota bacterium]